VPLQPRDYVAGYAAVVATAALGWQIWSSFRARRPQVTIFLDRWRSSQARGRRFLEGAEVRIRNREDYAVRVDRLFFRPSIPMTRQSVAAEVEGGDVNGVPFEVPPRDVISLSLRPSEDYSWPTSSGGFGREPSPEIVMELRTGERYVCR
jgi:hypothetical protein